MKDPHHSSPQTGVSTRCIHAGTYLDRESGSVCSPIIPSTVYAYPNPANTNVYPRYFNVPNQQVINDKMAALEHGESALVFGSGMAAIATLLFAVLKPGDHAVVQNGIYGGTFRLITTEVTRFGVSVTFAGSVEEMEAAVRTETKLIYVESPTNPLLRCIDLAEVASLGRRRKVLTIIDNTFATPVNQNPLDFGLDAVVHSATKYLNGHSDLNAGVVVASKELIQQVKHSALNYGGMLDARVCYLLERGMKTLALRMERHNANASSVAAFLAGHPAVAHVHYPGLANHPDHEVAVRQMRGFGGMLSFELADTSRVNDFLGRLEIVTPGLSLGGVESIVCVPAQTSHRDLSPDGRKQNGINDGLIRLSIGIENVEDLIADLAQALKPS